LDQRFSGQHDEIGQVIQGHEVHVIDAMRRSRPFVPGWRLPGLATAAMSLLSACSTVTLLNAVAPRSGISVIRDLRYGADPRQRLDVYVPRDAAAAPVVVFFYGGGWTEGSKDQYAFVARGLAARGIVTVVPDYRLYPQVAFPAFIQDGAAATRWVHDNARAFGGDPRRLVVLGHSAGAYIAAMLALDPRYLAAVGLNAETDLAGCVGLAGPYDFLPLDTDVLRAIFRSPEGLARTQPITFARGDAAPMLLLTGARDDTVYPRNTARLSARIRERGGWVETIVYPGIGHRLILGAISWPLRFSAPVRDDVVRFVFERHTATGAAGFDRRVVSSVDRS
jgi:acetyl esterase/lipase